MNADSEGLADRVSCQARADNPLHGPVFMAAMAQAADQAERARSAQTGQPTSPLSGASTDLPIIGIAKHWREGVPVYITPDFASAKVVADAGADIIAIDATPRFRGGDDLASLIARIRDDLKLPVFADISTVDEGVMAESLGATYVATTLAGYTEETASPREAGPDFGLIEALARRCTAPIIAEGRFDDAELAAEALARGAHAVVVGTMITNPREITKRFVAALGPAPEHGRAGRPWHRCRRQRNALGAPARRQRAASCFGRSGTCIRPPLRPCRARAFTGFVRAVDCRCRPRGSPDCIAAGVTGLGAGTPPAMTYAGFLSEGLGTPPVAIAIGDDMWIAYRALFAPGEGGLVYAGTGSVGYAIGKDGLALKVGGYGILIDDAGSGFWIAREAIRRILRARDEDPVARSVLADLLYERVGGSGWPIIREAVYGSDRGAIAALAPVVARASDAGDATAVAILSEAGVELARIGAVLARRGGFSQLALMGGAVGLHPVIFERFLATLPPEMTGRLAQANVADMAARLALAGAVPPPNS